MKIIAKFIGRDGSLGYKNCKYYHLNLRVGENRVCVTRKDEWGGSWEYSSFIKFLENRTDINIQND